MKQSFYLILIISLLSLSCKRKRKINVEGTVTDMYTGLPVQNVNVYLYSLLDEIGRKGETHQQTTDFFGHYYFKNVVFSREQYGFVTIKDNIYRNINMSGGENIKGAEIRFIGKTNLTKDIQVICFSELQLTLNVGPAVQYAFFSRKYSGTGPVTKYVSEFYTFGRWPQTQDSGLPNELIGYSDGKNIIKTDYFDQNTQTKKTQYDTIISQGCGSVNTYTINLN